MTLLYLHPQRKKSASLKGRSQSSCIAQRSFQKHQCIQEPPQLPAPGFINTARILGESEYDRIEERNKKEEYKTVQVFTRKEVHKAVE